MMSVNLIAFSTRSLEGNKKAFNLLSITFERCKISSLMFISFIERNMIDFDMMSRKRGRIKCQKRRTESFKFLSSHTHTPFH